MSLGQRLQRAALALSVSLLALAACSKSPNASLPSSNAPQPQETPQTTGSNNAISTVTSSSSSSITSTVTSGSETGVPSAQSVFGTAPATQPPQPSGRPNSVMTPAQESRAMPIPGQNNDHSAPLATTKTASSP